MRGFGCALFYFGGVNMHQYTVLKKLDHLNRLVIPADIRKAYGIENNGWLAIIPTDGGILITSAKENKEQE